MPEASNDSEKPRRGGVGAGAPSRRQGGTGDGPSPNRGAGCGSSDGAGLRARATYIQRDAQVPRAILAGIIGIKP